MRRAWLQLILVMGLLAGCQTLENRFVYHPIANDPMTPLAPPPVEDIELRTADGDRIHARLFPHPWAKGVLLYCSGNAGNLEARGRLMTDFCMLLERSVLIFDYPGYGRSEGKPTEKGCYAAADAAYDWLTRVRGIAPSEITLCGESLGGGVAIDLASRQPHHGLTLIRTYTSVPDVAKQKFLLFSAPVIMVNRFESLKKIPKCQAPIFIAQADRDSLIPFAHGEQLRNACQAPVRFHRLRGLDHNDPLPAEFFHALREFLNQPPSLQ